MALFIPTIDIYDGKAVLVKRGKVYKILGDPFEKAKFLSITSHFQIVDLNAAMDNGNNKEIIKKICTEYPCYVSGGIRTESDAIEYLNSSAKRVNISTNASIDLFKQIPKNRLILGLDVDENNYVFSHGRNKLENISVYDKIKEFKEYIDIVTITFHDTEGTCSGIPMERVKEFNEFVKQFNIRLCVAGGIVSIEEIVALQNLDVIPQFGSGFWLGNFSLGDVYGSLLNSSKSMIFGMIDKQLFPTVVQHISGIVLGLVYSTPESLQISVDTRIATFYSRDRNKIWIKGATSGHMHVVKSVDLCCDNSSIRMIVDGNTFCHTGKQSCFGITDPSRWNLQTIQEHIKLVGPNSYASKLIENPKYTRMKIMEEAEELIHASGKEIANETADLFFHVVAYISSFGIPIDDIYKELNKRRYIVKKNRLETKRMNLEFTIGIVTNGTNLEVLFSYLHGLLDIEFKKKDDDPRSFKFVSSDDHFKLVAVKPKDIPKLVYNNHIDAVLSFDDMILNSCMDVNKVEIRTTHEKYVKICVIIKEEYDFQYFKQKNMKEKLNIMSEYPELTYRWLEKNKLVAKIETVSGSSESYLVNNLCDMCVCVVDSGTTLVANNLKILDIIVETGMHMFALPEKIKILEDLLHDKKIDK